MSPERIAELEKLGITFVKGKKSSDDKIFFYNDKTISFRELGELYVELCKNEDVNYPCGKGGDYLEEFLKEVKEKGKVTDEIAKKYRLK